MKSIATSNRGTVVPLLALAVFSPLSTLHAQTNGTWTTDGPGNWSDGANWSGTAIASGPAAIADFSTLDITGDHLVTLDAPFTIGTLVSQDATTPTHNWTLGGVGPLTLDNLASKPVLNVINQSLAISTPLAGANGFSKTGSGTLDLSGTCTFGGTTTLAAGTLKTSGGDDRLPTATTLTFTGTTGTLDLTTTTQTLAGITVPDLLAASYTITGSSLTLDGTAARQFGPGGAVTSAHSVALNLSGLSSFASTAPASVFRVGLKSGSTNATGGGSPGQAATVVLADQNAITASTLAIGDIQANNHGGTSTLRLGRVNTLNVGSINTGASGRSNSNLLFDPSRINPSVTIRNTNGTSAVTDWRVGLVANFTASTWTDSVDLSAGTVDALVTTVTVGASDIASQTGRGGTENASFTMGAGTLEATTLLLGRISGTGTATITSTMAANGTFSLNHPSGVVKAATLTLAENTTLAGGLGARSVSGIFNLTAGTLEATTIQRGAQTGNASATAAVNWTNGTIRNLTASGLTINTLPLNLLTGSHVFDATGSATIALNATSSLSGTGGLTKTGTGTLSLQGANTYTGPTDVQAGTLAISNSFPNGSAFTVDASATLDLANVTLSGLPALNIAGNLNLTGPVTVGGPLTSIPGTLAGILQYGSITGSANLQHNYRSASFTVGATATDLNVAAGLPLTWTGAGGNSWDVNTTVSWKDASDIAEKFFWADSVTFDSAGSGTPNVNLVAQMQPAAVTVNEAVADYVFSGPGFISGVTGLTKDGAAKLTIATNNTNTGTTNINAGTLEIGSGGTTGWMGSGAIVNHGTLVFNRSNDITVANAISGTGSVTKLGAGTMTVTGNNSYAGGTNLQAGTLGFGSGALGTTGNITFTGNSTLRWETGNTEDISSRLVMTDGVTSIFNTNGNNVTLASGFGASSTGSLTKTGAGILELSGTNTYSGLTTIVNGGGTLRITNKDAIGTGNVRIATAGTTTGTLELALTGTNIISNPFNGFSSANNLGSGNAQILNTSGDNTITSALTITSTGGNGLNVASSGGFLTLSGTITHTIVSTRTLTLGGSGDGLVSGPITAGSSNFNLTKTGSGTWTLSGSNTYVGNTTVNGGTLALGADNVLPDNSNVLIGAGTLNAATFDDAVGTLDCSAAATIQLGTGGTLAFLASSGVDWTGGTLTITGTFVPGNGVDPGVGTNPGSLRFGTTNAGLSAGQLASISAPGWTGFALDDYGYLTATVAAGYASWASLNGAGVNLDDDHDNDGVDNGVEYFLGGPNGNTTGFTALPGVTHTGGILSVTWTKAGDYAGTYGTDFVVETSDTLTGTWNTEPNPGSTISISGNNVTYTFPSPLGTKRFARLKVTGP